MVKPFTWYLDLGLPRLSSSRLTFLALASIWPAKPHNLSSNHQILGFYRTQVRSLPCLVTQSLTASAWRVKVLTWGRDGVEKKVWVSGRDGYWVVRKIWLEDMEGDPGNPAAKLKSHRNAQDTDEREYVSWPVCILVSTKRAVSNSHYARTLFDFHVTFLTKWWFSVLS